MKEEFDLTENVRIHFKDGTFKNISSECAVDLFKFLQKQEQADLFLFLDEDRDENNPFGRKGKAICISEIKYIEYDPTVAMVEDMYGINHVEEQDIEFDYDDPIVKESWTWKETLILWVIVFALFGVPLLILHLTEHNF